MDSRLLDILVCPVSHEPLRLLGGDALAALNRAIEAGGVSNVGGDSVRQRLSAALVTRDDQLIYPIEDDIPVLLADQAIATASLQGVPAG